jgi:hypothetical protein
MLVELGFLIGGQISFLFVYEFMFNNLKVENIEI